MECASPEDRSSNQSNLLLLGKVITMSALSIPYLDPLNQALANVASPEILANLTIPEFLTLFSSSQQHEELPGVSRASFTAPVEDGIELWVYKTEGISNDTLLPYIYYVHGGGWSVGKYDYRMLPWGR